MRLMHQQAPYPQVLADLVARCHYRPGWTVSLSDDHERDEVDGKVVGRGLTLIITTQGYNSYHVDRGQTYRVYHYFIVPAATYDERSWRRWLFEQFLKVETHEAMEFFRFEHDTPNRVGTEVIGSNHHVERPYAPSHGPGNDPYLVREVGTDLDRRTSFRGEVNA